MRDLFLPDEVADAEDLLLVERFLAVLLQQLLGDLAGVCVQFFTDHLFTKELIAVTVNTYVRG